MNDQAASSRVEGGRQDLQVPNFTQELTKSAGEPIPEADVDPGDVVMVEGKLRTVRHPAAVVNGVDVPAWRGASGSGPIVC